MDEKQFDGLVKSAFGLSDDRYARLIATAPGGGTEDLTQRLREADRTDWVKICEDHAHKRAEEVCAYYKDGDLLYRDGPFMWASYWSEFDDALKAVGRKRRPQRSEYMDAAERSFVATIEKIRCRRLGPPEQRHLLDPDKLEWSATMGSLMAERSGGEQNEERGHE